MPKPAPPLPDLEALSEISDRIARAIRDDPALARAEPEALVRHVPGKRAVLSGQFNGQPAFFRLFLDASDPAPAREWAELTRIWPHMKDGRYRVVTPLHYAREPGLIVVSAASGTPLLELLWHSEPQDRAQWLPPAAEWLRRYTRCSETVFATQHRKWLDRAAASARRQPLEDLRKAGTKVLTQLGRLAADLDGQMSRIAICHGDFHPNNLIANENTLTGIDTGGSANIPIYKDMARFLMHMGRRGMIPSGDALFGVDKQGIAAFVRAFELTDVEEHRHLPFMLGCEALLRIETRAIKPGRLRRAAAMYDRLIADLTAL